MLLRPLGKPQRRRADGPARPCYLRSRKIQRSSRWPPAPRRTPEPPHDRIIPKGAKAHNPVRDLHIAQSLADDIGLHRHLTLSRPLGTAGIDQHIHHKVCAVPPKLPLKQLPVLCPSDIPQPVWKDLSTFSKTCLPLAPHQQRTSQRIRQDIDIPLHDPGGSASRYED